jgi:hypothetical protein
LVVVVEEQQQQGQPHWEFLGPEVKTVFCAGRNNCPRHATDPDTRTAVEGIVAKVGGRSPDQTKNSSKKFKIFILNEYKINHLNYNTKNTIQLKK